MKRGGSGSLTGTHVYTALRCTHNVALDLHGDRDLRRSKRPEEEFLLARGRDHEAVFVEPLMAAGWQEPTHPERDFAAGFEATKALLAQGVPGVLQGVLQGASPDGVPLLGIPDLMRRVDGPSELGDFHYEIGDVKSSGRMRGDQILQVVFYARILEAVQGRLPDSGYIVLKDQREERFRIADYLPALDSVMERLIRAFHDGGLDESEPFYQQSCGGCLWNELCIPHMEADDHLSFVDGMTPGVRKMLVDAGIDTAKGLAQSATEQVVVHGMDLTLVRTLQRSALARVTGTVNREKVGRAALPEGEPVVLYSMFDAFADRCLYLGARAVAGEEVPIAELVLPSGDSNRNLAAFLDALPAKGPIWHAGQMLPSWIDECSAGTDPADAPSWLEFDDGRFIDVMRRARKAAAWPRPVFGVDDMIELALGRDPHRNGRANEAAWHVAEDSDGGRDWLAVRGRTGLDDLAALVLWSRG